jgi:hypothetical protein
VTQQGEPRWFANPFGAHRLRLQAARPPTDLGDTLAALDNTVLESGLLYQYTLRIRVHSARISIDPKPDVTISSARERIFHGTVRPAIDGKGSVLEGKFRLFWMARFIFFPVPLLFGVGACADALIHQSALLGLIGLGFVYWSASYVVPRLWPVDSRRSETMIRDWLDAVMREDLPE